MIIHLAATNDTNGNPRRVYVRLNRDSDIADVWNEGNRGSACVPDRYRAQAKRAPRFEITPGEYRRLRRTL